MNDRFRFRAWDKWKHTYIYDAQDTWDNEWAEFFGLMVDDSHGSRFAVEQCTGLKDKNGKLIYEGDILKSGIHYYQVVWHEGKFVLNKGCKNYPIGGCDLMEIIGNIHENPELLEAI